MNAVYLNSMCGMLLTGTGGLTPDTDKAWDVLNPVVGPFRIVLGVLCIVAAVGIALYTAMEISYILFPVLRSGTPGGGGHGGQGGNGGGGGAKGGIERIVSEEAKYAVKTAETTHQNALLIYFKKRAVAYLILGMMLALLMSGGIYSLISLGGKAGSGVTQMVDDYTSQDDSGFNTIFTPGEQQQQTSP